MLALGMIAALAMPGTAQATPQLGDLGVKQSMSVKASNGESLEGKDLRAIQLATYTAASVDGNTIVGYDLTTNTALASDITAAAKAAGATDTNLTVNGKNDPMVWVVKNLTDSRSDPWSGKLRNFCNSLAKQTNFAKQDGTAVSTLSQDKATMSTGNVLVPGIYAIVDRTPATTTLSSGTAIKTTASIMMMNGTAVNGVNQLRTAGGTTLTLGQVIYKVSNVESPDKKVNVGSAWKDSASEAIGKDLTYRVTQKIPNWTGYEHYYLALNDTLGAGLDYGSLTSITVGGKALASTFYKENVNGKTISWLFGVNGDILASDASKAACRSARRSQSPTRPDSTAMRSSEAPATSTPSTWNTPTIPTHGRTTTTSPATRLKSAPVKSHYARSTPKAKSSPARNSPSPKAPVTKRL